LTNSFSDFFPYSDKSSSVRRSTLTGRRSFALDYALDIPGQSLSLGPDASLNITPPSSLPYLSQEFKIRSKAGDQDGVNLPWFSRADATLLFGQSDIYGQDIASLFLRARWTESGMLEIWPDSQQWVTNTSNPSNLSPLLMLENYTTATQAQFHVILPTNVPSWSPSYTYPVRAFILMILKPTSLALWAFVVGIGPVISSVWTIITMFAQYLIVYIAIVMLVWLIKGRPPFAQFFATSPFTRFIHDSLVPREEQQQSTEKRSDPDNNREQPKPLTSFWAFFRSTSPLDDLLVTFALTRRLAQPLQHRRASVVSESSHNVRDKVHNDIEAGLGLEIADEKL
jgi:hypothetical protein